MPYKLIRKKKTPRYMLDLYLLALKYNKIRESEIPVIERYNSIQTELNFNNQQHQIKAQAGLMVNRTRTIRKKQKEITKKSIVKIVNHGLYQHYVK